MEQQELIPANGQLPAKADLTPMGMLQIALNQGAGIEAIERIANLIRDERKYQSEQSFNKAFAAFKDESVKIVRNITITDGPLKGKKYADLCAVVDAATPSLSKHGLSSSWRVTRDEPQWIEVTCVLRHVDGHSESTSMGGPPDAGGAKSPIQARCSTKSYLERYTFLAITGLASAGQDDDGKASGLGADWTAEHCEWLMNCRNPSELQRLFATYYKEARTVGDKDAMTALITAKDKRKLEFAA